MTIPNRTLGCVHNPIRRFVTAAAVACLFIAANGRGSAQAAQSSRLEKPYALIYGTVYGPDNHSLYAVKIKIRGASEKKARWELYSDHAGEFAQRVPAGKADYVIWADLKGYKAPQFKSLQPGPEVTAHIENDERTDVSLHLK